MAPLHIRAKSDLGTLQDVKLDQKTMQSHRALKTKFNIFFGSKLTPDDSKANSARAYGLDSYPTTGSATKVKKLINHRMQTHKRKWVIPSLK